MQIATSLRDRHRAQTMREIVDAAFDLFETKGYSATTIEQIAAHVGISPRTFFRYFPNKEDVVFGDQETTVSRLRAGLASRQPGETPLHRVARVILEVQGAAAHARRERVRAMLIGTVPAVHARSLRLVEALEEEVATALVHDLPPPHQEIGVARMIAGAIFGSLRGARRTAGEHPASDPASLILTALDIAEHGAAKYFSPGDEAQ